MIKYSLSNYSWLKWFQISAFSVGFETPEVHRMSDKK